MQNKQSYPPLSVLPMLSYAVRGALDASKEQLHNLLQAKDKPYVLDDEIVHRIIKSFTEQNKTIAHEKALCLHWNQIKLTVEQREAIDEISSNLLEIEKINQQVLFLAEHFKNHTIDKILEMEDDELGLAYLTGKIYPPDQPATQHKPYQRQSFTLPPEVTFHHQKLAPHGESYTFRHSKMGELGRIDVIPHGKQSQITAYLAAGDPRDPMTELRTNIFHTIAIEFNNELEKKYGTGTRTMPPPSNPRNNKVVESKAMVCLTCNTPVALLVFAHDADTVDQLEDYARMMYSRIVEMNLPTWVIGAEEEVNPGKEGIALILPIWPNRGKAEKISSLVLEPMLYKLQTNHCHGK